MTDLLFADDFETGDFSEWCSSIIDGGDLIVSVASAIEGNFGMEAIVDDLNPIYVTDCTPNCETRYRARFYFDPNSMTIVDLDELTIFAAYQLALEMIRIDLRYSDGEYQIRACALSDGGFTLSSLGTWRTTAWYPITDGPHCIEFNWEASDVKGIYTGILTLWIDGVQKVSLIDIDSDTRCVDTIALGIIGGVDTGTSGSCYFDDFESRRFTYIGL